MLNTFFLIDWLIYATPTCGGYVGQAAEMAARSYTSGRLVTKVKPQGKPDAYLTYKGKDGKRHKLVIEYKTACGRIDNLEGADYIAYWPEPQEDIEAQDGFVVFTPEEWKAFLNGYTGRGQVARVRSDGETHIQSFRCLYSDGRPKASLPLAVYIHNVCDRQPTLRELVEGLRG